MSAFILGQDHIDFLVSAAINLGTGGGYAIYWQQHPDQPRGMWPRADISTADDFGRMLLAENIASVQHRYSDCEYADLPGPNRTPFALEYRYRGFRLPGLNSHDLAYIVQVLKAIQCYDYQSCEHPGWETSEAKRVCDQLRHAYIDLLPGYDDAAWEVERPEVAAYTR